MYQDYIYSYTLARDEIRKVHTGLGLRNLLKLIDTSTLKSIQVAADIVVEGTDMDAAELIDAIDAELEV
jgi:hypothetical protein